MTLPGWYEEPISRKHDRKAFACGDGARNDFLRRYVRQSHDLGAAKTFLAIDAADNKIVLGFYSLAPGALAYADAPEVIRRGLAQHDVPEFRLARIATHVRVQGQGLGGQLLAAAARRWLRAAAEVGGVCPHHGREERCRGPMVRELRRCALAQQAADAGDVACNFAAELEVARQL